MLIGRNSCKSVNGDVERGFQPTLERKNPQTLPAN